MQITKFIKSFARDEEGVTAIEYGLIAALIAVAIIIAATAVGTNLAAVFDYVATKLGDAIP
jgi:pilus assembly protein Flp/PilA